MLHITSLERAKLALAKNQENVTMQLHFQVAPDEIIKKLLSVADLTLPTPPGQLRNIIGRMYNDKTESTLGYAS